MELHFYLKQGNLHDSPQLVGFHIYLQFSLFFTLVGPDICSHADFTQLVTNPFQISHKSFSDPFFSCVTIGCRPKSDSFFLGPLPHIRNTPCRSIFQHSNISKCQKIIWFVWAQNRWESPERQYFTIFTLHAVFDFSALQQLNGGQFSVDRLIIHRCSNFGETDQKLTGSSCQIASWGGKRGWRGFFPRSYMGQHLHYDQAIIRKLRFKDSRAQDHRLMSKRFINTVGCKRTEKLSAVKEQDRRWWSATAIKGRI